MNKKGPGAARHRGPEPRAHPHNTPPTTAEQQQARCPHTPEHKPTDTEPERTRGPEATEPDKTCKRLRRTDAADSPHGRSITRAADPGDQPRAEPNADADADAQSTHTHHSTRTAARPPARTQQPRTPSPQPTHNADNAHYVK